MVCLSTCARSQQTSTAVAAASCTACTRSVAPSPRSARPTSSAFRTTCAATACAGAASSTHSPQSPRSPLHSASPQSAAALASRSAATPPRAARRGPGSGLSGHMHGHTWYIPLEPGDVCGALEISIPVLELAAIAINFIVFGPSLPNDVDIIVFSDSATSCDALADHTARSPLMQLLLLQLVQNVHYRRVVGHAFALHGYSETNVISDGKSRGYDDAAESVFLQLRVKHVVFGVPNEALVPLRELRARNRALKRLAAVGVACLRAEPDEPSNVEPSTPRARSRTRTATECASASPTRRRRATRRRPAPWTSPTAPRRKRRKMRLVSPSTPPPSPPGASPNAPRSAVTRSRQPRSARTGISARPRRPCETPGACGAPPFCPGACRSPGVPLRVTDTRSSCSRSTPRPQRLRRCRGVGALQPPFRGGSCSPPTRLTDQRPTRAASACASASPTRRRRRWHCSPGPSRRCQSPARPLPCLERARRRRPRRRCSPLASPPPTVLRAETSSTAPARPRLVIVTSGCQRPPAARPGALTSLRRAEPERQQLCLAPPRRRAALRRRWPQPFPFSSFVASGLP